MAPESVSHPLILVLGPTGSGKSNLALRLALDFDGEIVNCDSQQIYRGLNIGTAKPSTQDRLQVPHHLIDILDPNEVFSAGEFARRARSTLAAIRQRQKLPIVCGGTGFYVRALVDGLFAGPKRHDGLRARLNAIELRRPGFVHRLLRRFDPATASRIHCNDVQKAVRAVEVTIAAKAPLSTLHGLTEEPLSGYRILRLGLDPDRALLYERINERCAQMFARGLLQEVQSLLAQGYSGDMKAFESIGYRQSIAVLDGLTTLESAIEDMQVQTRRYAKRQLTWFRRDPQIIWLKGFGNEPQIQRQAIHHIKLKDDGAFVPRP